MWQYNYVQYGDVLCHHGIKGQKWGVRRYQNEDGTLTALGKKRLSKNGDITFEKGLQLYGVSNTKKPNSSSTYSPDKEGELSEKKHEGGLAISTTGKAFVNKYVAANDIKLPSVKKQIKIETSILKDPEVQKEIVNQALRVGHKRENAISQMNRIIKNKNLGRESVRYLIEQPETGATKKIFENKLRESGYNAYRYMRDRDENNLSYLTTKSKMYILDADKNIKLNDSHRLTREEYAKAYAEANQILNERRKKTNPRLASDASFEKTIETGKDVYDRMISVYKREQEEFRELEELDKE